MTEQQNTKAVDAIVHELKPRVDRPASWYHEHEREIARGQVVAQVESVLETKAFADAIENAVRRASSSDSDVGFVRIDRAIAALRWDLGIDSIDRPVPTTDEPDWQVARDRTLVARLRDDHGPVRERMTEAADRIERLEAGAAPHPPTREQIYQAAQDAAIYPLNHRERTILDAVLALIQNGADR